MTSATLLLHLGLPKTATSSLQHNVFLPLGREGRINFLGKCLDYNYKTAKVSVENYRGKFIRDVAEGKMSLGEGREALEASLNPDRLNVFSDEGIMVAYPGRANLTLAEKFANLEKLLTGYNVKVVVTLREPVDYLYSLYVELYPDFCSKVRELDSVEKYTNTLLERPDDCLFESYHFSKWLSRLEKSFPVTVIEYDQLKDPASEAFTIWSSLLGITQDDFYEHFNSQAVNTKKKSGKEVEIVRDLKGLEIYFHGLLVNSGFVFRAVKKLYHAFGIKKLLRYRFGAGATHKYPSDAKCQELKAVLGYGE
ncbi:hypothetical protein [Alcanivorax sp. DP30]|uniref:hypothetical protein n=1 Tax=Alcanivorax sp. DP30 TaxID=2606217 RepID=UPI00136C376E|nr:hypothetical protein [Alcanivorax sp. DP30]MZR64147.1 hypothetical protein [Alcanivorax sp. DP30]